MVGKIIIVLFYVNRGRYYNYGYQNLINDKKLLTTAYNIVYTNTSYMHLHTRHKGSTCITFKLFNYCIVLDFWNMT